MDYLQQLDEEQLEALAKELGQLPEEDLPLSCLDPALLNPDFDFSQEPFSDGATNSTLLSMDEAETLEKMEIPGLISDLSEAPLEKVAEKVEDLSEQVQTLKAEKINRLTNYIEQLQPFLQHIGDAIHDLSVKYKEK
ncbi:hypothetical protein D8B26_005383 [Coccidioides posadasii str. Silveira]|uniref:Uncharacterized protein n=1 Tax=Coccidioides posadasii (strain RMSCC 757 / Silveira) TaxID=443226 RepID=E9D558_COCPS|nr:conserved hypothetical protein [Coccidioides posadasii str. Silveira]QVM10730.1 hypothetical protein D8B26_005383 [Coccidioides posadasii str. Silveira]